MHRRKIQLVAGTTYSISLPKEWVKKNKLKEKNEIILKEKDDRTLVVLPTGEQDEKTNRINLNIEPYLAIIDQVLFALYYQGFETIQMFSQKELSKDAKARIRKVMTHMSGSEVTMEDKKKMVINVLIDKTKVQLPQVLYRIILLIESSITTIRERGDREEIRINENEIDRLYHLIVKIISLSLTDSNVLYSSKIDHVSFIPFYFLISKRLENVGDIINHLSRYAYKKNVQLDQIDDILLFVKKELDRYATYILSKEKKLFTKIQFDQFQSITSKVKDIKDAFLQNFCEDLIRYLVDIEEGLVNISFYNKLIKENML